MFRLNCKTQKYAWGKKGSTSAVALLASNGAGMPIDESENYAEFWFGTHKNGPARGVDNRITVSQLPVNRFTKLTL